MVLGTPVCLEGHILTARGAGVAVDFALKLVEALADERLANKIRDVDAMYVKDIRRSKSDLRTRYKLRPPEDGSGAEKPDGRSHSAPVLVVEAI